MAFQVHLRLKNHELLLQTLLVQAEEVVFLEMFLERVVVDIILLLAMSRSSITDMTPLVLVTTMGIQLVVSVEPLSTEPTLRVAFEAALVNGSRDIVSVFFVLAQFRRRKEFMLVGKHLFVSSAKVTAQHHE